MKREEVILCIFLHVRLNVRTTNPKHLFYSLLASSGLACFFYLPYGSAPMTLVWHVRTSTQYGTGFNTRTCTRTLPDA